jgi:tripartite-type tricarboxylate transporter receptor subunit TctC
VHRVNARCTASGTRVTMKQKIVTALLACLALLILQSAQAFPDRPVKLVVPSPAGGPPDIMARLLTDKIAAALGQPIIVENRAGGGGGTVSARSVMAAEPDGYTLLMGSTSTLLIAPLVYRNAGYGAESFAPVAGVSETVEVLAVHPSVPVRSVAELVNLAKSQPGTLRYGSAGIGTLPHLEGELLKARADIEMMHIPYRGGGPALVGLLGGEVQVFFSAASQMLPYIRDGRLRGLAVTSERRSTLAPELPTMVESGFDGFVTASINFIVAPPGTAISIREQLSEAVAGALASAQVKDAFSRIGAKAEPASPKELSSYVAQQQLRWAKIVETTRISID